MEWSAPLHSEGVEGQEWGIISLTTEERTMDEIARVGIDLAKKVFHVTALDAAGAVMDRKGELVEGEIE